MSSPGDWSWTTATPSSVHWSPQPGYAPPQAQNPHDCYDSLPFPYPSDPTFDSCAFDEPCVNNTGGIIIQDDLSFLGSTPVLPADDLTLPLFQPLPCLPGQQSMDSNEPPRPPGRLEHRTLPPQPRRKKHVTECPDCGRIIEKPGQFVIHVRSHSGEKPFTCEAPGCDVAFSTKSNCTRHTKRLHPGLVEAAIPLQPIQPPHAH